MKARHLILILAAVFPIICCTTKYVKPTPPKSGGADVEKEDKTGDVTFSFSAATSKYASLKESVTVGVDSPGKATVDVDWGDGSKDSGKDAELIHKYDSPGKYTVKVNLDGSKEEWEIEIGPLLALDEAVKDLYKTPGKVWVMAHRSHTTDQRIPENSVKAVSAAIKAGADVIETDTHRTKDGKIVISHDESIDNHTTGTGKITGMSLQSIRNYHLTDRNGDETDEVMPTLEEFLLAARGKVYVNLDYSPRTASTKEVLNVVESLGMLQQVFMYCKDASFVKDVFNNNPEANAYVRSEDYMALLDGSEQYFLQVGWNSDQTQKSECVVRCREAYDKGVLCSVNLLHVNHSYIPEYSIDQNQLTSIFELYPECQMIQTDCPELLIPKLAAMGKRGEW